MRILARAVAAVLLALALTLAACGGSGGSADAGAKTLVVATHDSWAMSKQVMAEFTARTGITVKVQPQGDAGELTNRLVLTKDSPLADGVYGIDNTFATRAVDAGVLTPYVATHAPASSLRFRLKGDGANDLTPIDYSDVCVNVDDSWFARRRLAPPASLDDLTKPAYKNLFVTPGATTSSPGLAFLLATIAAKGAGWQAYWKALLANGAKIDAGWSDAWDTDYTAGGGHGDRPIVLSYSSSPPDTVPQGGTRPTTSALLDTCFRQVEYAGVLAGSKNPSGMRKFIDFMLQHDFQSAMPGQMYVYPVDAAVALPADWAAYAKTSPRPYAVDPAEVTRNRTTWLNEWRDLTSR